MYLTLEVVSPQAASLGSDRRHVVSERGLTIGRVPGNDWVISDPYISKQHARITYANGSFFVEGLGRNAIAIGSPGRTLPVNQPQPLRNSDHLFIDQYEVIVTVSLGEPPGAAPASSGRSFANAGAGALGDDPFAVLPASPSGAKSSLGSIPEVWDGGVAGEFVETAVLDPIDLLGGVKPEEPPAMPAVNWQQASVLEEHFEPPAIPDNWDRTNLTYRDSAASKPVAAHPPIVPSQGRVSADGAAAAGPAAAAAPGPVPAVCFGRRAGDVVAVPRPAKPQAFRHEAVNVSGPEVKSINAAAVPGPFNSAGAIGAGFAELLRGAGLSERDMSPEMMQDLGKVLRVVVEGVMDVLRARREIKSQFRVPTTHIKAAENNPLKHSPNVESALHTLLVQRNPGYLSSVQAFEDAFADIRNHQVAMLEGLRVAFQSMLESFDPQELEKSFQRPARRGFGGAKAKYWDFYVDRFAQLSKDADAFRRLFGDVFAAAYEKQLERLKLLGRNGSKEPV
ncbi:MAG TPA: type VI secretion system-associated FHA domain protein TagH [Steroidobacteraceae bacterium]